MTQRIKRAVRHKKKGRVLFTGPSGSGKSWASLVAASILADGGKVGVIDTENGSAEMFAGEFSPEIGRAIEFDVLELAPPFSPERYKEAFDEFVKAGYAAIVIDSTTHEWDGPGGCLELHDDEAKRTRDSWGAWRTITPRHKDFLDHCVVRSPVHVIGTARAKTEYATSKDENGKMKVEKLGTGPIQRAQFEFEWDVLCDISLDHTIFVNKSRVRTVDGKVFKKDVKAFAAAVKEWLDGGDEPPPATEPAPTDDQLRALAVAAKNNGYSNEEVRALSQERYSVGPREMTMVQYNELKQYIEDNQKGS